jgi:hypothetical protein
MIDDTLNSNGKNLGFRATVERQTRAITYCKKCFSVRTASRRQKLSVKNKENYYKITSCHIQ